MNIEQVWPEWHEDCVLGEGSFGKVYRAKRMEYGRTFWAAIKVLQVPKSEQEIKVARAQGMNDTEIRRYFQTVVEDLINEITMMDSLKGAKNIVGIEDYRILEKQGEIGWEVFIRMELLSGFDGFASRPDYTQGDVVRMGVDLCSALEVCEQNHIIHRDIKPDNVFISRFGEYKLGDFGIARRLEGTMANLSRKGTLNYMAPEIYKGENYNDTVDIYSLGLMLYALLNHNRMAFLPAYPKPIEYQDSETALSRRMMGEPLPLPAGANQQLGRAVVKACAYDPAQRYQNASDFKNALLLAWETISQYGEDRPVNTEYGADYTQFAQDSTVEQMTAHETVLSESIRSYEWQNTLQENRETTEDTHNELCRVLSLPTGVLTIILSVMAFLNIDTDVRTDTMIMLAFFVGVCVLVCQYARHAMGFYMLSAAVFSLSNGMGEILSGLHNSLPIRAMLLALSGMVYLCGGIVMLTQKKPHLGGTLAGVAASLEAILLAMSALTGAPETWRFAMVAMDGALLLWAYGYDSGEEPATLPKVLSWLALIPAIGMVVLVLLS